MVHNARPLRTPRSSLASNGRTRVRPAAALSGERKEHVLQSGLPGAGAKLVERTDAAQAAIGEQHESVADTLGVDQLVDRQDKRSSSVRNVAQHAHDLPRLAQVEAV